MTQTAGPDLNKGRCAAALTQSARQVHLAVLAAFAQTGQAPVRGELERIARAGGAEPGTGRVITVHADGDHARWDPQGAVVFAGTTGDNCCHAADRTCGYINFFTTARAARTWAQANPTITGAVLDQARALSEGVAEFGAFMRTGDGTSRP